MRSAKNTIKTMLPLIISIFILQFFLFIPFAFTQDSTWVTVEGIASIENVSKKEAKRLAMADAMRKAVEEVVGVDILSETVVINYKVSGDIIRSVPYGKVIGKKILKEEIVMTPQKESAIPFMAYKVKMRVNVVKEKGKGDPFFRIRAKLNKNVFKEGDEVEIKVTPSKDCYITIFNIMEDENVLKLIPNRFVTSNSVRANQAFIFPGEENKRKGIRLIAHVGQGSESVVETFYILVLKQPLNFDPDKFKEGIFETFDGSSAFMNDLLKEIVVIPPSERAETFLQYKITR